MRFYTSFVASRVLEGFRQAILCLVQGGRWLSVVGLGTVVGVGQRLPAWGRSAEPQIQLFEFEFRDFEPVPHL